VIVIDGGLGVDGCHVALHEPVRFAPHDRTRRQPIVEIDPLRRKDVLFNGAAAQTNTGFDGPAETDVDIHSIQDHGPLHQQLLVVPLSQLTQVEVSQAAEGVFLGP